MTARLQVALLFGGRSGEHEVSLVSAASVAAGLRPRHDVLCVLIDKAGRWLLQEGEAPRPSGGEPVFLAPVPSDAGRLRRLADARELARPDVFFPVLHGTYGEDGTVQGLFELAAVPYVGAGVAASAASMDKAMMKALFARAGLPQPDYRVLVGRDAAAEARLLGELGLPVFVKPANLGSSVGISKVKTPDALAFALDAAFAYDRKVVVERGLDVRELEVSVLGNDAPEASVPGEVVPDREFYDYDSKYAADSRTGLLIPAPLDTATAQEVRRLGVAAFQAVDAAGFARVDFFLERATGRLLVNEINTIPGFTSISMYPKLWEASGLSYPRPARAPRGAGARAPRRARPPSHRLRLLRPGIVGACIPARAVLAAAILAAPALAFSSGRALSHPADAGARAALDLVYDGDFRSAEARLATLAREHTDDPVLPYLQALALEWRLEQDPREPGPRRRGALARGPGPWPRRRPSRP